MKCPNCAKELTISQANAIYDAHLIWTLMQPYGIAPVTSRDLLCEKCFDKKLDEKLRTLQLSFKPFESSEEKPL